VPDYSPQRLRLSGEAVLRLTFLKEEYVLVLEYVKAARERSVTPQLFLISFRARLFEVLHDYAL
jgi:hypothetical protein